MSQTVGLEKPNNAQLIAAALGLKAGLASWAGENSTKRESTAAVVTPTKPTAAAGAGSRIRPTMTATNSAR